MIEYNTFMFYAYSELEERHVHMAVGVHDSPHQSSGAGDADLDRLYEVRDYTMLDQCKLRRV